MSIFREAFDNNGIFETPPISNADWQNTAKASVAYISDISGGNSTAYYKALKSALRVARDFDRNVKVMWSDTHNEYHIYGPTERCSGNFDVCLPNGHIIH